MASKKDKTDVLPKEKKSDVVLEGKKPADISKKNRFKQYAELGHQILNFLIALVTFFTVLKKVWNPWLIFSVYLIFIVVQLVFIARKQKRPVWEPRVIVLFSIINTAIFFLWIPTWFNEIKCGFYDINIESPKSGAGTGGTFTVSGSYRFLPPPDSLILINESTGKKEYWPSASPIQFDQRLGTWSGEFYLNGESGTKANVDIALLGKPGRVLYTYYLHVGKDTNGQWPSIPFLTDDIRICDTVEVVRK